MISNKEVEALITDQRFQELKYRQEKTNVFSVVGQTHTEHWHSAFLSWLFDAHSSLRLGHFPLARLLSLYMIKKDNCSFNLRDIFSWDLDDVRFSTEKDASFSGHKRSIDVYGESDELILVIENKVNARENFNKSSQGQTMDYYNYVESHKKPGQTALYFFITADQNQKPYADMYVRISYQELYDEIISKCIDHPQCSPDGKYLLEQYAANLRETIHNSNTPMALVNVDLCKSLYADHSDVLDSIFKTVEDTADLKASDNNACIIYDHYANIFDEIFLSVDERFGRTPKTKLQRQVVTFDELYRRGAVQDGMRFTMKYDGEVYLAEIVSWGGHHFLQILQEDGTPFLDRDGSPIGLYPSSSSAGVDSINLRRRLRNDPKPEVRTLCGTTYWVNDQGKSVKDLINEF